MVYGTPASGIVLLLLLITLFFFRFWNYIGEKEKMASGLYYCFNIYIFICFIVLFLSFLDVEIKRTKVMLRVTNTRKGECS